MIEKSKHYKTQRLLSYQDADILMSIGGRGIGKTYGFKDYCIKRYLKHNEQFVYLRRYESELTNMQGFFSDLNEPYIEKYDFKVKGDKFLIKAKDEKDYSILGYIMTLSKIKTAKGAPYPLVGTILFDEFLVTAEDKLVGRYLKGEEKILCDLYESIARERNVKLIMISNAISTNNPYFHAFHVRPKPKAITRHKTKLVENINGEQVEDEFNVVLEMVEADDYMRDKAHTRSGKMMMVSGMAETSLNNDFYKDNYSFIEQVPKNSKLNFLMNIKTNGKMYGIFSSKLKDAKGNQKVYALKRTQPNNPRTYCCDIDELDENTVYVKGNNDNLAINNLKIIVKNNMLYFQTLTVKYDIMDFLYDINIL